MKLQRTYLSREMTRAMSLDHPIGDPFGGPAYYERNLPALALIGAAMSIEVGITLLATNVLVGGLMIAGGVLSALGTITGNETLSKLGMVAGLAGGIAGVASMGFEGFANAASGAFSDSAGLSGMLGGEGSVFSATGAEQNALMGGLGDTADVATSIPSSSGIESMQLDSYGSAPATPASAWNDTSKTNAATNSLTGTNVVGKTLVGTGAEKGSFFSSDMAKYGMMTSGSDFLKSLATAPSEEDQELAKDKVEAEISRLESEGNLVDAKALSEEYALTLAQLKTAQRNDTNYASFVPTVQNPGVGLISGNANTLYKA